MKKKILISILIIFSVLIILGNLLGKGCIVYHEGSFKGKVIDAETKEPIEGVVVLAIYNVRYPRIIESDTEPEDAVEVLTNKNGEFYIPWNLYLSLKPLASGETPEFIIYKPGYCTFPSFQYFEIFPYSSLRLDNHSLAANFKQGITIPLPKLKTTKERDRSYVDASPSTSLPSWKYPKLNKLLDSEYDYIIKMEKGHNF